MRFEMHLNDLPFNQILSGEKTLEVRLNDSKRQLLQTGDEILFLSTSNENKTILKSVIALRKYDSFAEMALVEDSTSLGFGKDSSIQDIVDTYRKYYSPDEEKKFGILLIELK